MDVRREAEACMANDLQWCIERREERLRELSSQLEPALHAQAEG